MGLRTKFNLALISTFLLGFAIAWYFLQQQFVAHARDEVLQDARIMMSAASAVRGYTAREIAPLLVHANTGRFEPASVPSYAAQTNFRTVQAQFSDYTYREPALNPTNPTDRATDWEADFINAFRNRPGLAELVGERDTPTGRALSLARPINVGDMQCLTCHSTPDRAPASMISAYGPTNGFGWQLGETVAAQVVSVPMALALDRANSKFVAAMQILCGVFLAIMVVLNLMLHFLVIRPVLRLSRIASAVSLGEPGVEEFQAEGRDEIAGLSRSLNRMRRSLDSAMSMLDA
ncbi:DUF3365 domain-containing protein [Roseomonas sp. NAR14]|uniref:DUF3365 domain-containing protein n=1 Tax=Roseomonas acroporae TaxID=2937791 RepID=A0A9X1YCA1_9PROT|nr:DUF3365 domain-containing protein [Roseomonas acroporae]MCK8787488.1 DUF3365 domain-containing protein [Roseomonas acroporae]